MKVNTSLSSKNCFSPGAFDFSISSANSSVFSKHLLKPFYLLSNSKLIKSKQCSFSLIGLFWQKISQKILNELRKHMLQKIHIQSSYLIH
jgi:hypothetical protein